MPPFFGGLWRHRDFPRLWGSLTLHHFGGQITFLALPLTAALVLNASPFEVGVLTALEALPYPIFGLFAGVLVDRARKLPVIIACDVGRGLALAAIPLAHWMGMLSMPNHAHSGTIARASPRPTSHATITGSFFSRSTRTPANRPKRG